MSVERESFYVPVEDYSTVDPGYMYGYGFDPVAARPNIRQTIINPVPHVRDVYVNELLPFQVSPTYTIDRWTVRSNIRDRDALANQMLLAWRPESLDYGSEVDTTSVPQVFLFTTEKERTALQNQLYQDYPELNLQSYKLKVPVRISTHTYPGASFVPHNTLILPGSDPSLYPPTIDLVSTPKAVALELPPEILKERGYPAAKRPASRSRKRSSRKRSSQRR